MRLLGNRILVQLDKPTQSGLVITTEQNRKLPDFGTVQQLGSGTQIPPELTVGARVRVDNSYNSVGFPKPDSLTRIYSIKDIQLVLG